MLRDLISVAQVLIVNFTPSSKKIKKLNLVLGLAQKEHIISLEYPFIAFPMDKKENKLPLHCSNLNVFL